MLCIFTAHSEEVNTYKVILYHKANPPYSFFDNDARAGIFYDIFAEIGALTGLKFEFVTLSVARGRIQFNQGKVDIEPGINPIWRRDELVQGLYSISYAYSNEVILAKNETYTTDVTKFYGEVIGKVRGYGYGDFEQHFGEGKILISDNVSESMLIEQLYNDRFKYIMIGEVTAAYYAYINDKYSDFTVAYEVQRLPVSMRIHPKHPKLLEQINDAIRIMLEEGTIEAIYGKYGFKIRESAPSPSINE